MQPLAAFHPSPAKPRRHRPHPTNNPTQLTPPPAKKGGRELVISRRAGEAVLRGAEVFVPGVLAVSGGVEAGELVAVSVAVERPPAAVNGGGGGGHRAPRFAMTRGTVLPAGGTCRGGEEEEAGWAAAADGADGPEAGAGGGGAGGLTDAKHYIGVGRLRMGRAEIFRLQSGVAVEMVSRVYNVASVPGGDCFGVLQ